MRLAPLATEADLADRLVVRTRYQLVVAADAAPGGAAPLLALDGAAPFPDLAPGSWLRLPPTRPTDPAVSRRVVRVEHLPLVTGKAGVRAPLWATVVRMREAAELEGG